MGGKRLPPEERKERLNISMKKKYIDELRKIKGYSSIVEKLIVEYLDKRKL